MDAKLTEIYEALAAGREEGIDLTGQQRALLYICVENANSDEVETRLGSLRVSAYLTPEDRLRLVEALITDADAQVRRYAFNLALEAREQGLAALKAAVGGADEALAVEALGRVITQGNRTDGLHARKWLNSDVARIRAGAAMLLGNISGRSLAVPLRRLAESDPDPGVREVAGRAMRRALGEEPKVAGQNHWEAGPTAIPVCAGTEPVEPEPPRTAPAPAPVPPDAPAPPVASGAMVPAAEQGQEDVRDPTPSDWRAPSPLPAQLPGEIRALVKLLGMVSAQDRTHLLRPLAAADKAARNTLFRSWRSGSDPALGRGIALAIGLLDLKNQAMQLRAYLRDPEPGVRAGAAEGVGEVGAASLIPPVDALLHDSDEDVRLAAIRGLSRLLTRTERFDMLRRKLQPLAAEENERIKQAATDALAAIG